MRVAFLGAGRIATALAGGLVRAGLCKGEDLAAWDPLPAALDAFCAATGAVAAASNADAAAGRDVVLLCVKPGDAVAALGEAAADGALVVSVAAGVSTGRLAAAAPGARIVRAMPNTAALVGRSATALASGHGAGPDDAALAETVFSAVGRVFRVPEAWLDAVTGLSGSGPAFLCLALEALADGGVAAGLPRPLAQDLAVATLAGTAALVEGTGQHPALLREAVTSPGGTTVAGLFELEAAGVRAAFARAVQSAAARSRELSA